MRILLVEDDARVASLIRRGLREENYTVDVAPNGEDALFLAQTGEYDLLILERVEPTVRPRVLARSLSLSHLLIVSANSFQPIRQQRLQDNFTCKLLQSLLHCP